MNNEQTITALKTLGFNDGWVVSDGVVIAWDYDEPQPTTAQLENALS